MKETLIKGSGNSRSLITVPNAPMLYSTHEELMQKWATVGIPVDIGPLNEAGLEQRGTDLTKPNLLSDETEVLIWGDEQDRTPNDALAALKERIDAKQIQSVSGSKSFSSDTTDLTLPFLPDYLIAHFQLKRKDGTPYFYGFATAIFSDAIGFNRTMYFSVAGNTSANYAGYVKIATVLDESSLKFSCTKTLKNIAETSQSNATIDVLYEAIKLNGGLFK